MAKYLFLMGSVLFFTIQEINAQSFHGYGKITFEKKVTSNKWAENKTLASEIPESTSWELMFNRDGSLYKRQISSGESVYNIYSDQDLIYTELNKNKRLMKRTFQNISYIIADSIPKLRWKILQDVRMIAGYECRKAISVINDSVYVVAFYSERLLFNGGPEGFTGLPGTILGLAIPRYQTTWFATNIELTPVRLESHSKYFEGEKLDFPGEVEAVVKKLLPIKSSKEQIDRFIRNRIYGLTL